MKVTVKEPKKAKVKEKEYPYLGIGNDSGSIVLFTGKDSGIVIESNTYEVCYSKSYFDESFFPLFKGKLILSND